MTQFVLIDGNSVGYAQQLGMTRLSVGEQSTHAIYGFLLALRKLSIDTTTSQRIPIVLWDGAASWRKEIDPSYKSNRRNDEAKIAVKDDYSSQVPFIREALKNTREEVEGLVDSARSLEKSVESLRETSECVGILVSRLGE